MLNLSEQIEYLASRGVSFSAKEVQEARGYLLTHGLHHIASFKYLLAMAYDKTRARYHYPKGVKQVSFSLLKQKCENLAIFENSLCKAILALEDEIKSRVCLFLDYKFKTKALDLQAFLASLFSYSYKTKTYAPLSTEEIEGFKSSWTKRVGIDGSEFDFNTHDYLFIKLLSFGCLCRLLDCSYSQNGRDKVYSEFYKFTRMCRSNEIAHFYPNSRICTLRSLNTLRNTLCHKEPLIIYLDRGYKIFKSNGRDELNTRIEAIELVCRYAKGNLNYSLKNTWVGDFARLRTAYDADIFSKIDFNILGKV